MSSPAERIQQQVIEQDTAPQQGLPHGGVPGYSAGGAAPPNLGVPGAAAMQARGAGSAGAPPSTSPFTEFMMKQPDAVPHPNGYEGGSGSMLYVVDKFLEGAAKSRQKKYAEQEDARYKNVNIATNALHGIVTDPNVTPEAKQQAQQAYDQYLAKFTLHQIPKGADKAHPTVGVLKNMFEGMTGGKLDKKWDGTPSEFLMQVGHLRTDPNNSMGAVIGRESATVDAARKKLQAEHGPYWTKEDLFSSAGPSVQRLMQSGMSPEMIAQGAMATPKDAEGMFELQAFRKQWQAAQRQAAAGAAPVPEAVPSRTGPPPGAPVAAAPPAEPAAPAAPAAISAPPTFANPQDQADSEIAQDLMRRNPMPGDRPMSRGEVMAPPPQQQTAPPPATPATTPPAAAPQAAASISPEDLNILRVMNKQQKSDTLYNTKTGDIRTATRMVDRFGPNTGWYDDAGRKLGSEWSMDKPAGDQIVFENKYVTGPDGKPYTQRMRINKHSGVELGPLGEPEPGHFQTITGRTADGQPMAYKQYANGTRVEDPLALRADKDQYEMQVSEITGQPVMVRKPNTYGGTGQPSNQPAAPTATQPPPRPQAQPQPPPMMPGGSTAPANPYQNQAPPPQAPAAAAPAAQAAPPAGSGPQLKYPKPNPNELAKAVVDDESGAVWNGLTSEQKGQVMPIVRGMGYTNFGKLPSSAEIAKIEQTKASITELDRLIKDLEENKDKIGPARGWIAQHNPWSGSKALLARIGTMRQVVGKGLEGGVLRKEDEMKYKEQLSGLDDPDVSTSIQKSRQMKEQLQRHLDSYTGELRRGGRNINSPSGTGAPPGAPPPNPYRSQ